MNNAIILEKVVVGSGAPVTGDQITADTSQYPVNTPYIDKTNGAQYVRTGVGKVTGDWTQIGGGSGGGVESVTGELVGGTATDPTVDLPYYEYTFRASQSGTNAPEVTVIRNTLGGDPVWTYIQTGAFRGTLAGAFPANKVIPVSVINPVDGGKGWVCAANDDYITENGEIKLESFDLGAPANGVLNSGITSIIRLIVMK